MTNLITGRLYIGKKLFIFTRTKRIKGRRKKEKFESDWKEYYSSSNSLKADVESQGQDTFERRILHFCETKSQLTYLELKEQIIRGVLESDSYYNEELRARVRKNKSIRACGETG